MQSQCQVQSQPFRTSFLASLNCFKVFKRSWKTSFHESNDRIEKQLHQQNVHMNIASCIGIIPWVSRLVYNIYIYMYR